MAVGRDEVLRLARLARLRVDPDELDSLTSDLNALVEHVASLGPGEGPVPEMSVPPAAVAGDVAPDPLRIPLPQLAPRWRDGFFAAPRPKAFEDEAP